MAAGYEEGIEGTSPVRKSEIGGQAQFDWTLDGGCLKAQPIKFLLVCCLK